MFSLFNRKPKTRLVKSKHTGNLLPQYSIQEHSVTGWSNAEPVFYATNDELALEVYKHWKERDQVETLLTDS